VQQASEYFQAALVRLPNNTEMWLASANCLLALEKTQDGAIYLLEVLRRMRNRDPRKPTMLFNLAATLGNMVSLRRFNPWYMSMNSEGETRFLTPPPPHAARSSQRRMCRETRRTATLFWSMRWRSTRSMRWH
jgi:hypothetical protein